MTESLTERLRLRAAAQATENEKIISGELSKLTATIKQQLNDELRSIQNDISGTSLRISADLTALKWASRYWWAALIATWLIWGGLYTWHSITATNSGPTQSGPMTLADYQTFTHEGRSYLIVPQGSIATTCTSGEDVVGCIALPSGE
mgnify:CR=1 FL=1|tara:strand:+ start:83 stop:526 length:444 start_codon:yes stop_codon:yes gene_type:complete